MTAAPGWYPDPGGQSGTFRYWDGRAWSSTTTSNPYVAPPSPTAKPWWTGADLPRQNRRTVALTFLLIAGLLVLVLVGVLASRALFNAVNPTSGPQANPTAGVVCPTTPSPTTPSSTTPSHTASPVPDPGGDRVVSGHLSYPRLAAPFGAPQPDPRTPFGRDVQSQEAVVEQGSAGVPSWVAAVLIARLLAGDGFYGPQQGAAVVAQCVIGKFYGDNPVQREDLRNEATTVDGHEAWIIEMQLTFDIPDIETKGEVATIVVVDTAAADGEAGLFYSSIPDTSPQFTQPARDALDGLQVS